MTHKEDKSRKQPVSKQDAAKLNEPSARGAEYLLTDPEAFKKAMTEAREQYEEMEALSIRLVQNVLLGWSGSHA